MPLKLTENIGKPVSKGLPQGHELVLPQQVRLLLRDIGGRRQEELEVLEPRRDLSVEGAKHRTPLVQHLLRRRLREEGPRELDDGGDLNKKTTGC